MPKKVMKTMKARAKSSMIEKCFPKPKKGKWRMAAKSATKVKKMLKKEKVAYTRHGCARPKSRGDRTGWKRTALELLKASDTEIIKLLVEDGILEDLAGTTCTKCLKGKLGSLSHRPGRTSLVYRCGNKQCKVRVCPHNLHPIFSVADGQDYVPLQEQAAILFCALVNVKQAHTHKILGRNHKLLEKIYERLDECRVKFVERVQKSIVFGERHEWADIEADEVDLRKSVLKRAEAEDPSKPVVWEQWGGVVERGYPETLVLTRLNPAQTKMRSPGPGPMRTVDWRPFAMQRLQNKKVILHTDGAKAYQLSIPGVLHDHVVHMKKHIMLNGVESWVSPKYAKLHVHTLPNGKKLKVMAGTQVIDRFWRHARSFLDGRSSKVGSQVLLRRLRAAQWDYWHTKNDKWLKCGEMLIYLRKL